MGQLEWKTSLYKCTITIASDHNVDQMQSLICGYSSLMLRLMPEGTRDAHTEPRGMCAGRTVMS